MFWRCPEQPGDRIWLEPDLCVWWERVLELNIQLWKKILICLFSKFAFCKCRNCQNSFFYPWIFTCFNSDVYHQLENSGRTHANGEFKSAGVATIWNSRPIHFSMAEIATHMSYTKVCFSGCSTSCVIHYKYLQFIVLITYGLEYHSSKGLGNHLNNEWIGKFTMSTQLTYGKN